MLEGEQGGVVDDQGLPGPAWPELHILQGKTEISISMESEVERKSEITWNGVFVLQVRKQKFKKIKMVCVKS